MLDKALSIPYILSKNGTEWDELGNFLIGSYTARIDKSGRIKIPEKFRGIIEERYGKDLFVTSLTDESIQIYPYPVWEKLAQLTDEGLFLLKPNVRNFMLQVNLKGKHCEIDTKGRALISQVLRDKARLENEIEVVGMNNHLEVWNKEVLEAAIAEKPLTNEDFERISEISVRGKSE